MPAKGKRKRPIRNDVPDEPELKHLRTSNPSDENDELQDILARIREQEESEALALQLNAEWNDGGSDDDIAKAIQHSLLDQATGTEVRHNHHDKDQVYNESSSARKPPVTHVDTISAVSVQTPDAARQAVTSFISRVRPCSQCGTELPMAKGYAVFSESFPPPSLVYLLHVRCPKCRLSHCRGCFRTLSCPISCVGNTECTVATCCTEIRAIALYELLSAFDRIYLGETRQAETRVSKAAASTSKVASHSVGPGGTGYALGSYYWHDDGVPHSHHLTQNLDQPHSPGKKPTAHKEWDDMLARAPSFVTSVLPSPYCDCPQLYDILPHESVPHLLTLSQLPDLLDCLLRNDSITDWTARNNVYYAALALLRRLAESELTLGVLIEPRWIQRAPSGLDECLGMPDVEWKSERGSPLYAHFSKLTRQCETFLGGAAELVGGSDDDMAVGAASLCGDIIAARDDIERAMRAAGQKLPGEAPADGTDSTMRKGKAKDTAVVMEAAYTRACERLAFAHVPILSDDHSTRFAFSQYIRETKNATRNPKDRLHFVRELAVMATSLPPGVWVRVDEVRNDALKIMIAGPSGTPYDGGLFEFDCFMPLQYPNTPPMIHLRTTGNGTVRFNPNLYNSGKVCLSLLGTWSGRPEEQWQPYKSTLLQVLVSIQSMILVDMPFFNEPGFGQARADDPRSIQYNTNIRMQSARWAIIDWLHDRHRSSLWADVIYSHFSIRAASIRATIRKWWSDSRDTHGHSMGDILTEFEQALKILDSWSTVATE